MPRDIEEETKSIREEIDKIIAEREKEKINPELEAGLNAEGLTLDPSKAEPKPEVTYPPCIWCGGELAPVESGRYLFCRECKATANFRELKPLEPVKGKKEIQKEE